MASGVVQAVQQSPSVPQPTRNIQSLACKSTVFDPEKHISYSPPSKTITLESLGLNPNNASSSVACTAPFPLLTEAGIHQVRADIFRKDLIEKYGSMKYPGVYRVRGYGEAAPFVYSMWRSEAVRKICSQAAGVELEIVFDYEIGQLNVQLSSDTDKDAPITETLPPPIPPKEEGGEMDSGSSTADSDASGTPFYDDTLGALGSNWHNDSYPWVCVLMLSDAENMKGGETAIRTGSGEIVKMKQPGMGYAIMMQGGSIHHAALRSVSRGERITMVTSFRPKDPLLKDTSTLATVKGISDNDILFTQWTTYRMGIISRRAAAMKEDLDAKGYKAGDIKKILKAWVEDQIQYLTDTVTEMG